MKKTVLLTAALPLLVGAISAWGLGQPEARQTGLLNFVEPNEGQASAEYSHIARARGYTVFLSPARVDFLVSSAHRSQREPELDALIQQAPRAQRSNLQMQLLGASDSAAGVPTQKLGGHSNYLYGADAKNWITDVPHFATLKFDEVYPGIDVVYTLQDSALRYDFVLEPGADASAIRLRFDGAQSVALNDAGDVHIRMDALDMVHSAPRIFQHVEGTQRDVAGGFVVQGDGSLQFRVAAHDPATALVIDPQVTLSTYLGGSGEEIVSDIAVDATDRIVVTGNTDSLDFPGAPAGSVPAGGLDVFVARFAPDGQSLEFVTFVGGAEDDEVNQVAIDNDGNILLGGFTASADFPTVNAFQTTFLGGGLSSADAFVAKLDPTGAGLIYSTYIGGSAPPLSLFGFEWVRGLTVDAAGNAYVVGETSSVDFPANDTVAGRACLEDEVGATSPLIGDAFVAKLSPTGALELAVCIGGSERDTGRGIDLAPDGAIHIVGFTRSPNYPVSANAFQTQLNAPGSAEYDPHVTRLDPSGTLIDFATFVGGSETDFVQQVRVLEDGASVVVGSTFSTDFPTTAGAYQTTGNAQSENFVSDAIVFRLAPGGTSLQFSTFLGGTGSDGGFGLDVDADGRIYVASSTRSLDFPQVNATQAQRGGPVSIETTLGPATDETRALASALVRVNDEFPTLVVAANADVSRTYELDFEGNLQRVQDLGALGDNTVAAEAFQANSSNAIVVLVSQGAPSRVFFADPQGVFQPPVALSPSSTSASAVVSGYLIDTGSLDIVIGSNLGPNVVYEGTPAGFASGQMIMPGSETTATLDLAVGDLNGDGFNDVIEANDGINLIYFGTGSVFQAGVALGSEGARSTSVQAADMDGDTDLDIVIGNDGAPDRLYRNLGDGTFAFLQDIAPTVATTRDLITVDFTGNGALDIVTADAGQGVAYINDGTGQFQRLDLKTSSAPAVAITGSSAATVLAPTGAALEVLGLSTDDNYLAVFDASGRELLFSSYVGGSGEDLSGWGLFVKDAANVYLAGSTRAADFPTVAAAQSSFGGLSDGFVTRLALDDLMSPTPSAVYETVLDLAEPTIDGIDQVVFKWSTLGCNESAPADLYNYELQLLSDGVIVYSDGVVRDGIVQPFRGLPRDNFTWDFDIETLTLRQFNTGIDALVGLPEAFGTNYLIADDGSLPEDGLVLIRRYHDGVFVGGDDALIAGQTTALVAGDCDADGVDASVDNCLFEANADQRDTDGDNIGNVCDADLNNDCVVNFIDLGVLRSVFFTADGNADFNNDGVVNFVDLGVLRASFFAAPGPSGLPNICQ